MENHSDTISVEESLINLTIITPSKTVEFGLVATIGVATLLILSSMDYLLPRCNYHSINFQ